MEGEVDESARQSKCVDYDSTTYPVEHQEILAFIQESLEAYLTALPEANSFPEFTIREQYSIHKYEPGDAYHAVHSDYSPLGMLATRHLSFLLYLNSVEDGGETEFVQQGVLVRPVEGRLLIFPSGWTHAHRSLTATTDRWIYERVVGVCMSDLTVLGAGTAGLLAAGHFHYWTPWDIEIIYDPDTPAAAVGEGSTPNVISAMYHSFGLTLGDLGAFDARLKLGIDYDGWNERRFTHWFYDSIHALHFDAALLQSWMLKRLEQSDRITISETVHHQHRRGRLPACHGLPRDTPVDGWL